MKRLELSFLFILIFHISFGIGKPKIEVDLQIKEKGYATQFADDLHTIERRCEAEFIKYLNTEYGFVEFVGSHSKYKLQIEIDIKERSLEHSESELKETGFFVSISGMEDEPSPIYWRFKPESEYWDPLPENIEPFIFSINNKFQAGLDKHSGSVIENLLSKIPIVNDAFYEPHNSFWIIPVNKDSFRIDVNSEIVVENIIESQVFEDIKRRDVTQVYTHIKDVMAAHEELQVPEYYPSGSLVTKIVQSSSEPMVDFQTPPKIYLIKYNPFVKPANNGLVGTDEQLNSANN